MRGQVDIFDDGDEDEDDRLAGHRLPEGAHTRRGDPWTSHEAGASIPLENLRASQRAVYDCFVLNGPMHHQRLVVSYGKDRGQTGWPLQSESGLRTRTSELVDAGLLRRSDEIVVLISNRRSIVWEIAA